MLAARPQNRSKPHGQALLGLYLKQEVPPLLKCVDIIGRFRKLLKKAGTHWTKSLPQSQDNSQKIKPGSRLLSKRNEVMHYIVREQNVRLG